MASGYRDKIIWVILLGALVRREMSWKVRLVIFIDIIICPVLKCHVCRNWDAVKHSEARFLPLVLSFTLTSLQTLTVAKQNKSSAHVVNSKRGLICHMPPPPPDSGGLSLATGFFFQVADLWGLRRETKVLNVFEVCRWRPRDGTLKKAPTGIEISSTTPVTATLRNLSPGQGSTFHLCTDCPRVGHTFQARHGGVWRGIKRTPYLIDDMSWHKSKVMIFHRADKSAWTRQLCLVA